MTLRSLADIRKIVLHSAATPNGNNRWKIADINDWHRIRGFRRTAPGKRIRGGGNHGSVGYHRVIHCDGTAHLGRALEEVGAHCFGENSDSVGICLMGTDKFTPEQWVTLERQIDDVQYLVGAPLGVHGHYEFHDKKTDPNFDVWTYSNGGLKPMPDNIYIYEDEHE